MPEKSISQEAPRSISPARWLTFCTLMLIIIGSAYRFRIHDLFEAWVGVAGLLAYLFFRFCFFRLIKIRQTAGLQITVSCITLFSLCMGRFLSFYQSIPYYDKSQHFLFGVVLTGLGLLLFYRVNPSQRKSLSIHPALLVVFLTGFALMASFAWELFEYICDRLFDSDMQAWKAGGVHGLSDTMLDLLLGLAGSAALAVPAGIGLRRNSQAFYRRWLQAFFPYE